MVLAALGWDDVYEAELARRAEGRVVAAARVVRQEREWVWVDAGEGSIRSRVSGQLRHQAQAASDLPIVGDWVLVAGGPPKTDASSFVVDRLTRRSSLARRRVDGTTESQPIAANVDVALIVVGLDRAPNVGLVERAVVMARAGEVLPVLVLAKADLAADAGEAAAAIRASFADLTVHVISARTGEGTEALAAEWGPARTAAMIGPSGVGKSTLLNRLAGHEAMATGAVREDDRRGRHTTTHRQLFRLPSGALLIDGPGIRELGVWAGTDALDAAFPDVVAAAHECAQPSCHHRDEPGCGVRDALHDGRLTPPRVKDYLKLLAEIEDRTRPRGARRNPRRSS